MRAVYFDIDQTLLLWPGGELRAHKPGVVPVLNDSIYGALKSCASRGDQVVIWSAKPKSIQYLKEHFPNVVNRADAVLIKPNVLYDDNRNWIDKRDWVIVK